MTIDRRSLLKWFGAGAVIAPVVNGLALSENHAQLIETPKVEIAKPPDLITVDPHAAVAMFMDREVLGVTVFAKSRNRGVVFRMDCESFIDRMNLRAPVAGLAMMDVGFTATGPVRFAEIRK
jgi:hypothetical protein